MFIQAAILVCLANRNAVIHTYQHVQFLSFNLQVTDDIPDATAPTGARDLIRSSHLRAYVKMGGKGWCFEDLISLHFGPLATDPQVVVCGEQLSISCNVENDERKEGFGVEYDVNSTGLWNSGEIQEAFERCGIDSCMVTSFLESWIGKSTFVADILSAAKWENDHFVVRNGDRVTQLFFTRQINGLPFITEWQTFNEGVTPWGTFLIQRTRKFSDFSFNVLQGEKP